ncbi:UMP kinase [Candidatus Thiodictyon syntrophicum]|jgi:uridylate kinase|uniref:Uridylate kinase n=1 Tax=Candidatus Thiodictyon syntrophicum TaxID=1166950 RepID=A0A2K8UCU9_9GAMM|nr:UMP kinase [Candidatus Thiodictyon syntrophicum]AUB83327.1 UMP kinase [Candidatus Thiodictyon syntrophicum]
MTAPIYRRILLKLSGEALAGGGRESIDPDVLEGLAGDVRDLVGEGIQVALVIGGGNIFRGAGLAARGMDRVTGDQIGMLATLVNALAMQDALERRGVPTRVMSALSVASVCEDHSPRRALRHLAQRRVVIFAAGTGNPFFTTDSAASLRAIEIGADLLIKATKVDGIYSADPLRVADATFYPRISYDRALREGLQVMDTTAIVLCRDHGMALRVMNINEPGALLRLLRGDDVGSLVVSGD